MVVTVVFVLQRELLASQRERWQKVLLQAFKESKIVMAHSNQKSWRISLYPYLCILDNKEYVDAMLQVSASSSTSGFHPRASLLAVLTLTFKFRIQGF